jgi:hypothetical protein
MNSKSLKIGILGLALVGAAVWYGTSRSAAPVDRTNPTSKADQGPTPESQDPSASAQPQRPVKFSLQPKVTAWTDKSGNLKDQASLQSTLSLFAAYERTMLLSPEEKKEKAQLFSRAALAEVQKFLMTPEKVINPDVNLAHQKAVDFFIAGHSQHPEAVRNLAREFILDPQLDQGSLRPESRQLMAKDKAEILFHLMAQDPKFKEDIKSAPLGASTKALLEKVQEEHSRNLSESEKEVAAYKSGRW